MISEAQEVNFDGLVGPTHNYSGLSYGNIASETHQFSSSNPREAALQGLEKMKFLHDLGLKQAILPPHERPYIPILKELGFSGDDEKILRDVSTNSNELLLAVSSSAAMWTANAATVSPSSDSQDKRVHFTPANLCTKFHRSLETATTARILQVIFKNPDYFIHHPPLPRSLYFADEGGANHTRFCKSYPEKGLQLFIFGRDAFRPSQNTPQKYPARQTKEASQAIARKHLIPLNQLIFAQQNPKAIDAGAFHNDVISVGNQNIFFCHEQAFLDQDKLISQLKQKFLEICEDELVLIEVKEHEISLQEAISSYLFNSQVICLKGGKMALIAPQECQENPKIWAYLNDLLAQKNQIQAIYFLNLRQSMQNGGGPACLRQRIVLTPAEIEAVHPGIFFTTELYTRLKRWILQHYRDRLDVQDLKDPQLLIESRNALQELTAILGLGSIYSFQTGL